MVSNIWEFPVRAENICFVWWESTAGIKFSKYDASIYISTYVYLQITSCIMELIQHLAIQIKASGVLSDFSSLADIFPWALVVSVVWISVNCVSNRTSLSTHLPLYRKLWRTMRSPFSLISSKMEMLSAPLHRIYLPVLLPALLSCSGGDPAPLLSPSEAISGVLCPVLQGP